VSKSTACAGSVLSSITGRSEMFPLPVKLSDVNGGQGVKGRKEGQKGWVEGGGLRSR